MPSSVFVTMASIDESTMLASIVRASRAPHRSVTSTMEAIQPIVTPDPSRSGL
jgi:hypothetical protein